MAESPAPQEAVTSSLPDTRGIPLDAMAEVSDDEYAWIMRRAGLGGDGPGTTVSAFSSSI